MKPGVDVMWLWVCTCVFVHVVCAHRATGAAGSLCLVSAGAAWIWPKGPCPNSW